MLDKPSLSRKKSSLRPDSPIKAILFDLDGVLLDSNPIHHRAFLAVLREVGVHSFDYRLIAGMKTSEAMDRILKQARIKASPKQVAALIEKKRSAAHHFLSVRLPIRPYCLPVLRKLHRRFKLALISSSSRRNVDLFMKASGTRRLFSVSLSGDDVTKAKPSPAIYKEGLKRLKIKASQALVVEDAVSGILAARCLKIKTVAMSGTETVPALRKAGAEKIFATLMALARYADHL